MSDITLDEFRDILRKLKDRADEGAVEWIEDREEETLSAEYKPGWLVSLYYHGPTSEHRGLAGAVLHINKELAATLEAETNKDDWSLLKALHDRAAQDMAPPEELPESFDAEEVRKHPHRFDPFHRPSPSQRELVDGDSPMDENQER